MRFEVNPTDPPKSFALVRNLIGGLRLLLFLPVDSGHFTVSWRQGVVLALLSAALWAGLDRLSLAGGAQFSWYGVQQLAWLALVFTATTLFVLPRARPVRLEERLFTAAAAALPGFVIILFLAVYADLQGPAADTLLGLIFVVLGALWVLRILRRVGEVPAAPALRTAIAAVTATCVAFLYTVQFQPQLFYSPEGDEGGDTGSALDGEELMYRQPALIDAAVARLAPGQAGRAEVYFAGFAGDGTQGVFANEVRCARDALARKYDLTDHSIELVNTDEDDPRAPLATGAGLRRALAGIGSRMNVDEDALVLFLTSHGSEDGELQVSRPGLWLNSLTADGVAEALRASGIKWRVIIVSACYSGAFIEPLADDYTFILTAARADRMSFGCGDDRDLTYFGEAFFRDALPASTSLEQAAHRMQQQVTERERSEHFTPSEPQIFVGERMRAKLNELKFSADR